MKTGVIVTTKDRPEALERSLFWIMPAARLVKAPVLVVIDGGRIARELPLGYRRIRMAENRGLACALNVGLSYWLADPSIEAISYFQDDVEADPRVLEVMNTVLHHEERPLCTGRDASEHETVEWRTLENGIVVAYKKSSSGVHLHATRGYWEGVMPIPTHQLGAPKRIPGQERGVGSNVDWWVTSRAPASVAKTGKHVCCVPGLVRTFCYKAEDSSWGNAHKTGEDPPLSRKAIQKWLA